jgi:hypothetical protein
MVILIGLASFSFLSVAFGSDLDQDCNPRGWIQKYSAWWNPVGFWSAQPSAIQQEVESRIKGYQVYLVQRQANVAIAATEREKARIEQAALEEQVRILGVKPKQISPEISQQLDQVLAKADETIEASRVRLDEAQRQGVADAIRWGEKCVAFSREQLAKARR